MEIDKIKAINARFEVFGKWDDECSYDILASFPYNPLLGDKKGKSRANILANEFVKMVNENDFENKLNQYYIVNTQSRNDLWDYCIRDSYNQDITIAMFGTENQAEKYLKFLIENK